MSKKVTTEDFVKRAERANKSLAEKFKRAGIVLEVDADNATRILGCDNATIGRAIKNGDLRTCNVGEPRFIRTADLYEFGVRLELEQDEVLLDP